VRGSESTVNPSDIFHAFAPFDDYIRALGFAVARITGLIIVMPAFTRLGMTGILQGATALALALPVVPVVVTALAGQKLTVMMVPILMGKEVMIGVVIGLVLGVPIWAADAAGDILDLQRGSTAATLFDPSAVGEEGITGTLLALVMVALYFGSGGLRLTLGTVYESYGIWPAGNVFPTLNPAAGQFFIVLLDRVMTLGLLLVAPIVVFMLLSDLLLGLVSRASPQLNVFALSLSVKNLVFTVLLVLYAAFLIRYMEIDLRMLLQAGSDLDMLAKPAR
jgi:type III secretion protein T